MSENVTNSMWGRNPKRKVKYAAPKPAESAGPPVGPVDDPELLAKAATIIKSDRPAPAYAAPAPRAPREHRDPDEHDFALRDLVVHMAKGLVDHPDSVQVEIVDAGDGGMLELQVHPDDIGHVIGKQGRTARSLRLTLDAAARRVDRRVALEIAD
jgi:predicted RNA-binding protein YlqC (UPF0109 family)